MIKWKECKGQYSNGYEGFVGEIKCPFFWYGWDCFLPEHKKIPYTLTCIVPFVKRFRLKNKKECKQRAEEILKWIKKNLR